MWLVHLWPGLRCKCRSKRSCFGLFRLPEPTSVQEQEEGFCFYFAYALQLTTRRARLPSWNRRGGAERRGGRSHTISTLLHREAVAFRQPERVPYRTPES